ncbi:sulfotransferase 1E1-like [Drosophila subpulchrella]|uniref:sulfotransferase 1E1-like n=1 Tax=Drosophila subpulchrella TaxID=1486046 RepID=UPI0018A17B12|nr:sulfotransferase 1E1-like [Drosophila subpulchrella]
MKEFISLVHDLDIRGDNVWVVTPKCGTTWMQELLWLLINNCDFDGALAKDQCLRSPFLEYDFVVHGNLEQSLKRVQECESPRLIKSHLPLAFLPAKLRERKNKVIYVFRNPLDAWVSRYYHGVTYGTFYGKTLHQYFDDLLSNENYALETIEHAAEFYQLRNEPWVFYTSFERMKKDLRGVINDVSRFLNTTVTDLQMERLLKHLSFEEMQKNPTTNHLWEKSQENCENAGKVDYNFLRRGKVNGYKNELLPEHIEKAKFLIQKQLDRNNVTLEELLLKNNQ